MNQILETVEVVSAPDPTVAIIWMHGLGADANDFVPFIRELDLRGLPAIRFVFPNAPTMPITLFGGQVVRAWFDVLGNDIVRKEDEPGLRLSQARIENLIARETARGIPSERIILAGFSQGCGMTLQTGLRHPARLAGLMCLSGWVPLGATVAAERSHANACVPIFMAHGQYDQVVPFARAQQSRDLLTGLGYAPEWHEYPMEHSTCREEIRDISAWLHRVLA